ncbi:protein TPX2-like [Mangifera indica]|uniref:protein TPX2-like n=1 Tax=Mangifera indica TaxID=29780 RepID=UPI001CFC3278|nr:protein TPX2-like [Mangifera indica]
MIEMDEGMEVYTMKAFKVEEFVFDIDYEFDAAQYFDFSQPETSEDTMEAERWFESAAGCPPSPFISKSKCRYHIPEDMGSDYCDSRNMSSVGLDFCNDIHQDIPKFKTKSVVKSSLSRSSTLMKPTASYLAKHSQPQEVNSQDILRRKMDKCSQNSSFIENLATKRQKLDVGYLCKVSHLKHQTPFLHKVSNEAGLLGVSSVHARSKVTIPREPNLKTANRAQRHRFKVNAESTEHVKSNNCTFKARPLNRKIFESPALPLTKKSTLPLTECQEFQLRTSERARQHAHSNVVNRSNYNSVSQNENKYSERLSPVNSLKEEKFEVTQQIKSQPYNKQEFDPPVDKTFLNMPPIELFNKLSLASVDTNIKPQSKLPPPSKELKENTQSSFHLEHEMLKAVKKNSPRFGFNQYQCGSESTEKGITEGGARYNINRNLDIH